jgi:hypothetical protein
MAPIGPSATGQAEVSGVAYLTVATVEVKAIRGACGISRRLVMSESDVQKTDVQKTAEAKGVVDHEIKLLLGGLEAGTIDRKKLESGLVKICGIVRDMPPHKK